VLTKTVAPATPSTVRTGAALGGAVCCCLRFCFFGRRTGTIEFAAETMVFRACQPFVCAPGSTTGGQVQQIIGAMRSVASYSSFGANGGA
jgi:hypothetical protein